MEGSTAPTRADSQPLRQSTSTIIVYTGHLIDGPERLEPRFPAALEPVVADEIVAVLGRHRPLAVYGSAACGADLLVLEAALDRGAEAHVVLPVPPALFRALSVDLGGGHWGRRFERVLERAESLTIAADERAADDGETFHYANLVLTGLAQSRCRHLGALLVPLAVWDGRRSGLPGGTDSLVEQWRGLGHEIERIDMAAIVGARNPPPSSAPEDAAGEPALAVRSMLRAEVAGYEDLAEDLLPYFFDSFLGAVARLRDERGEGPALAETSAGGISFLFHDACAAGRYALALRELAEATDWAALGMPTAIDLRLALHAAPVFTLEDPLTGCSTWAGPHRDVTDRAAAGTRPGQIRTTIGFAAVAAASARAELVLDPIEGRGELSRCSSLGFLLRRAGEAR